MTATEDLPPEPPEWTVVLTADNFAFQRVSGRWYGQQTYSDGFDWYEVIRYHGAPVKTLWSKPATPLDKARDMIAALMCPTTEQGHCEDCEQYREALACIDAVRGEP